MLEVILEYNPNYIPDMKEVTTLPPKIKEILFEKEEQVEIPRYHVILFDDSDHTYDYVIDMLMSIFGHNNSTAFQMACEVDVLGRVVVYTSNKEHAEHKRDQIINYGSDWRLDHSKHSMRAIIELANHDTDLQQ
jgi:ATP-dependent Clp protease adaptor protein ClpS